MRATLVTREGVDLVDDDGARRPQHAPASRRRHQQVERLRRGDHYLRRVPDHRGACRRGRVAVAHRHADVRDGRAELVAESLDLAQGAFEVLADIDGECPQGGHIDDFRAALRGDSLGSVAYATVDGDEEAGECLARSRRRGDEGVLTARDRRPAERLRLGRPRREAPPEPFANRRVEELERVAIGCPVADRRPVGVRRSAVRQGRGEIVAVDGAGHRGSLSEQAFVGRGGWRLV